MIRAGHALGKIPERSGCSEQNARGRDLRRDWQTRVTAGSAVANLDLFFISANSVDMIANSYPDVLDASCLSAT
jgi:hypothetical protein